MNQSTTNMTEKLAEIKFHINLQIFVCELPNHKYDIKNLYILGFKSLSRYNSTDVFRDIKIGIELKNFLFLASF